MEPAALNFDPYANDPGHWGASLVNLAELLVACLEAAGARSVVEVGAYAGDLTGLLSTGRPAGRAVSAVDPSPRRSSSSSRGALRARARPGDEPRRAPHVPIPDAAIIDGDHN